MKTSTVSVVIATYNYGRFLATSVESVLAQTYPHVEVVVVDDGSTDNTGDVLRRYAGDGRVRCIHQENRGQAVAKNVGIRNSTSPFVAFLDADDAWEPSKLERQLPLFDRAAVGLVYTGMSLFDEAGGRVPFEGFQGYLRPQRGTVIERLIFDNFVPFSSAVVRRTVLDRAGCFDESIRMGIDWDLWLRLSLVCEFDFVDEPLLRYRVGHADQMSLRKDERFRWADAIRSGFVARHPEAIPDPVLARERAYTFTMRGKYHRDRHWSRSTRLLLRALTYDWTFGDAYRELLRNLVAPALRARRRVKARWPASSS